MPILNRFHSRFTEDNVAMKPIFVHVGDRVHHKTLGDGIVVSVNDDYCTARFGEKEANFRIPEAFVRGYLTSQDARIGTDEEEKHPIEEILPAEKKGSGCMKATFIIMGAVVFTPFVAYYVWSYGKTGDPTDLLAVFLFIVGFMLYLPLAIRLGKVSGTQSINNTKSGLDAGTELMIGMLGAEAIDRKLKSAKAESEKRRYDSLYWQESIRDKNPRHDFDYDHLDD